MTGRGCQGRVRVDKATLQPYQRGPSLYLPEILAVAIRPGRTKRADPPAQASRAEPKTRLYSSERSPARPPAQPRAHRERPDAGGSGRIDRAGLDQTSGSAGGRADGVARSAGDAGGHRAERAACVRHVRWYVFTSAALFSDGVTEARRGADRELYGDERLRRLVAGLHDLTAVAMAEAIQLATLSFGGGRRSDDTVALVMQVPRC